MIMRRFVRDESGIALLEFALFATMLLLLVFGAVDFGRAIYTANNMTSAAREGARYGATFSTHPCTGTTGGVSNMTLIKNYTVARMVPIGGVTPVASHVTVTCPGTAVNVVVAYPFTWVTPLPALMGRSLASTLHGSATFRWEFS